MGKQIIKMIFLMIVVFGICAGIYIPISRNNDKKQEIKKVEELFASLQSKEAQIAKFYTYGDTLNVSGSLENVSKENLENVKLVVTDGENEMTYDLETKLDNKLLMFETPQINKAIELDKLKVGEYYVLLRVKRSEEHTSELQSQR